MASRGKIKKLIESGKGLSWSYEDPKGTITKDIEIKK